MIRLKDILREDVDVTPTVKKIQQSTDNNEHTRAVSILAKFLHDNKSEKILKHIEEIHQLEGGIPQPLEQYRSSIRVELLEKAKKKYGQDAATKFNSAF